MSMKNLVYNKLARQNIFCFINAVSSLVALTYCYHSYYYYHYFYYYYHYYYCFIVIVIIIVFSIIIVIHFILFHFYNSFLIMYLFPPNFFSFFLLVNDLQFIFVLLIYVKHHFSFSSLSFISSLLSSFLFYCYQHYQSLGENSVNEFEWHSLPLPIDYFE